MVRNYFVTSTMTKNLIIAVLALLSLLSLGYGTVQHQRAQAMAQTMLEMEKRAIEQQALTEAARAEAEQQRMLALEAEQLARLHAEEAKRAMEAASRRP